MIDIEKKKDITKVISITQFEFQQELDKARLEQKSKAREAFNRACGWLAVYPWYNGVFEEFVKALED